MAETVVDILTEAKAEQDALLVYANGITGVADTGLGDAIKTLCDGFGGRGAQSSSGTYVQGVANNIKISIAGLAFDPDIFIIRFDESQEYTEANPTKAFIMIRLTDISDISADAVSAYNNVAFHIRGAKGTNNFAMATLSTNCIDISTRTVVGTRASGTYPIMPGTYLWYAYKFT